MGTLVYESIRYRDKEYDVPVFESRTYEPEAVKEVFNSIYPTLKDPPQAEEVEYAGFSFDMYIPTEESLNFKDPSVANALIDSLRAAGLTVNPDGLASTQNIFPGNDDCLDWIRMIGAYWNPGCGYRQEYVNSEPFSELLFMLGPVIRYHSLTYREFDEYNQNTNVKFFTGNSVILSGSVILGMLREDYPQIDIRSDYGSLPFLPAVNIIASVKKHLELEEPDVTREAYEQGLRGYLRGRESRLSSDEMTIIPVG